MTQAIGLAVMTVLTYAMIAWTGLDLYWAEFGLMFVAIVGIGAIVARAGGNRPFLKAAATSFMTVVGIESLGVTQWIFGPVSARPEVLPPIVTTALLMIVLAVVIGGLAGAVAVGLRSVAGRKNPLDPPARA